MKQCLYLIFIFFGLTTNAQDRNDVIIKVMDKHVANNKYLRVYKTSCALLTELRLDTLDLYGYALLTSLKLFEKTDTSDNDILIKRTKIIEKYYNNQAKNFLLSNVYYNYSRNESSNLKAT